MQRRNFIQTGLLGALAILVLLTGTGCRLNEQDRPEGPVADFTWSGEIVTPTMIHFQNLSVNADRYSWLFPRGGTSDQQNPSVYFDRHGLHPVTLIAFEIATNRSDTLTRTLRFNPGRFLLDSVIVEQMPFVDANGTAWDAAEQTGPDLYYLVTKPNGSTESSSFRNAVEDLSPDHLPVGWKYPSPGYYLANWAFEYSIGVYDKDGNSMGSPTTKIGTVKFRIDDLVFSYGYTNNFTMQNGSLRIRITANWE